MAAAACLWRAPRSTSVVAFSDDALVLCTAEATRDAELVVNDLFRLRGHGTTDLAFALRTAHEQLQRTTAARRVTILLSDARSTAGDDPTSAATLLDELVVVAPSDDADAARDLAAAAGGRCVTVSGPNSVADALLAGLGP